MDIKGNANINSNLRFKSSHLRRCVSWPFDYHRIPNPTEIPYHVER